MNPFIVADAESCIGCRSCEVACVVAHHEGQFPDKPEYFTPRVKVFKGDQCATQYFAIIVKMPLVPAPARMVPLLN
ncbi:hypothetical protein A8M56_00480 [Yersinia pestis]|nr:hypothetical protein A8M56_00480 [Yersinia pestis]